MSMLPDLPGIYKIENTVDGKFYIGSAINLRTRRNRHFSELRKQTHYNTHLKRAFKKYGESSFRFIPILICEKDELFGYENQIIERLSPQYNIRTDCLTNRGIKWTTRNKNSLMALRTPKTKEQLRERSLVLIMNKLRKNPDTGIRQLPSGTFRVSSGLGNKHLGCFSTIEEARRVYLNHVTSKYGGG